MEEYKKENKIKGLINTSIIDQVSKTNQEKLDADIDAILDEFPVSSKDNDKAKPILKSKPILKLKPILKAKDKPKEKVMNKLSSLLSKLPKKKPRLP